jgi:transposase
LRRCSEVDLFRVVIRIATETDIERLRQVALLLEQENDRLHRRLQALVAKLAEAQGPEAASLQLEIQLLQEQLRQQRQRMFGASSEKKKDRKAETTTKPPHEPQTGHGPTPQSSLPSLDQVHELDEADRVCSACGGELSPMAGQFEEAEEIDVVERSFRIVRHRRQKYRCACGGCVETALGPPKLIPGGRYSVGFAAEVAIGKYVDHAPLARQVRQMARAGLEVTTQTLWDQLEALARHLTPSYEALRAAVLAAPVVGADETRWALLEPGKAKTWWVWSVSAPEGIFYRIAPSRSAEVAAELLGTYQGVVMCDGYRAYGALQRERDGPGRFVLAHCWSHVRRKFVEAEPDYPKAGEMIALIGELYAVEAEAGDDALRRAELRGTRSRALVRSIRDWAMTQRALPESSLGKAIQYLTGIWEGLVRFLDDPAVPLDNNATERGMRSVALGRKNHYGSRSRRGTQVAALFYSLVESAKLAGIEPALYLREAARRAILAPGTATLPHRLLAEN